MLPHVPWNYLPTGREYPFPLEPPWADSLNVTHGLIGLQRHSEHWTSDPVAVALAYHRYLLQLGFVDRLVGRLIDHLKEAGLYDGSLILLTADHGVSCRPDHDRRNIDEVNAPDILSIPLLVKLPHQREGRTSDRNVQTADLLPTIADVLKIELPWEPYGVSVFDASRPEPAVKEISREEPWEDRLTLDGRFEAKYGALATMLAAGGAVQGEPGDCPGAGDCPDFRGAKMGLSPSARRRAWSAKMGLSPSARRRAWSAKMGLSPLRGLAPSGVARPAAGGFRAGGAFAFRDRAGPARAVRRHEDRRAGAAVLYLRSRETGPRCGVAVGVGRRRQRDDPGGHPDFSD